MTRPNYFILLELSPDDVPIPAARVEAKLREAQTKWTRQLNHPRLGREAGRYLEWIDGPEGIRSVLLDQGRQREEAEAARRQRQQDEAAALEELGLALEHVQGALQSEQIELLRKRFRGRLPEEVLLRHLGSPVPAEPTTNFVAPLERSEADAIARDLRVLGVGDLYTFLGCAPDADGEALGRQIAGLDAQQMRDNNKTTSAFQSRSTLLDWCRRLLLETRLRRRYDASRVFAPLYAMEEDIRLVCAGGGLSADSLADLVRRAVSSGVPEETARRYVQEFASRQGRAPADKTPALSGLRARAQGNGLFVQAEPFPEGYVVLFRSPRHPPLIPGQAVADAEPRVCGERLGEIPPEGLFDPDPDTRFPVYFAFRVAPSGTTFAGAFRWLEITRIEARADPAWVELTWAWPERCDAVCVEFAGVTGPVEHVVRRVGMEAQGSLHLAGASLPSGEVIIRVRCVPSAGAIAGPGKSVTFLAPQAQTVEWRLSHEGLFRRHPVAIIVSNRAFAGVRLVRLVGRVNVIPESATEGRCLAEWRPAGSRTGSTLRLNLAPWPDRPRGDVFCRLFVEGAGALAICNPPADRSIL